jgi:drug/metabolite transporter (DMT)-like permease
LIIFAGITVSLYDFQWSQAILSSYSQIMVMVASLITQSISSLYCKRAWATLEQLDTEFTMVAFTLYEYTGLLFSLMFMVWKRDTAWVGRTSELLSFKTLAHLLLCTVMGQSAGLLSVGLHKSTPLIMLGVLNQVKGLLSLVASHIIFRQTVWHVRQLSGAVLLFIGGASYVVTQDAIKDEDTRPDEQLLLQHQP